MGLATVHSRAQNGLQADAVAVEVHLSPGLPGLSIVGLPEAAVRESRDRVRAAILNSGYQFPNRRITVNLAPADLPKEGGRFDLPIALGILAASEQIPAQALDNLEVLGELSLTGEIRMVRGVLPAAIKCSRMGRRLLVPEANAAEASLAKGCELAAANQLGALCAVLHNGGLRSLPAQPAAPADTAVLPDLAEVRGQFQARRALEIAAAGAHSLLMCGPPGSGKSMLAVRLPGILPPLSEEEAMEVAAVASISAGGFDAQAWGRRPYRAPHHTASGVALVGGQGSTDTLGRVTRVEVLKGPQGTLFGRNATGGAINVVTPDPGDEFSADVNAELGNYAERKTNLYINVPIVKDLAASVSAYASDQRNFYTDTAGPIIPIYSFGGRAKIRWDILDSLKLTVAGSYGGASNNAGLTFENTRVAPILCPAGVCILPQDPSPDRVVSLDSEPGAKINTYLGSATVDWKAPWVDVKLIGSTQRFSGPFVQADFDKSALPIVNIRSIRQVSPQVTGELQFLSNDSTPWSSHFKWVMGVFYLKSQGGFDPIAFDLAPHALEALGLPGAGFLTNTLNTLLTDLGQQPLADQVRLYNYGVLTSRSYSAYFQGTYKILDSLDFTLGIRGQHEDRALIHSHTALATADGEITLISSKPPGLESDRLSPRVALEWHPFDDSGSQIYASWSRAYKSPTYNTVNLLGGLPNVLKGGPDEIKPLRSEKVTTAEVGAKTDWFDGALRLDVAAFYTWQKDLLTGFVALESGGVVSYENAPAAKIEGAEMDFVWTPLPEWDPGLAITGAASYLDGRYTDYPQGRGFDTTTGLAFGSDGTEVLPARNFDGNRIVRTPNFTGNLGVNQSIPIGENSRIELAADTNYSSGFFFLPQDSSLYARNPYNVVNARVSYFYEPAKVQLTAFVQNLGNISYNEVVFVDDFGRNQVLNAPRTFGGRVKWSF